MVLLTGLRLGGGSLSLLEEAELTFLFPHQAELPSRKGWVCHGPSAQPVSPRHPGGPAQEEHRPVFGPAQALGSLPALTERACDKV